MISAILYGRNDSYGYNLHKRAAISLNTLAEILTDPGDEIIFVDYNTVDDLPTFPEAIADTLTPKARKMLRTIRVRSWVHLQDKLGPRPQLNEPLARNIGIRRMRPENRWVLSTNTDMVFVPRGGRSLSDIAAALPDGYYGLPRFEVPETLWETVNRQAPADILDCFARWGARYCLNEIVLSKDYILFDGPGDFQLFPHQAIHALAGFDERMVYGWHVDSNLAKRMRMHYGCLRSLDEEFLGYHCDHTRVTTPAHSSNRLENNWTAFCETLAAADIPGQQDAWGRAGLQLEEVLVGERSGRYVEALDRLYPEAEPRPEAVTYTEKSYNNHPFYNTRHAFPFIADTLVSAPRSLRLAYLGQNRELVQLLGCFWRGMGFELPILAHNPMACAGAAGQGFTDPSFQWVGDPGQLVDAELFLIDNHCPGDQAERNLHGFQAVRLSPDSLRFCVGIAHGLLQLAVHDQNAVLRGSPPRKFILAGVQNSTFEALADKVVGLIAVPFSCHIRHGFVRQENDVRGLFAMLSRLVALDDEVLGELCGIAAHCSGLAEGGLDIVRVYDAVLESVREAAEDEFRGTASPGHDAQLSLGLVLAAMLGNLGDLERFSNALMGRAAGPDGSQAPDRAATLA